MRPLILALLGACYQATPDSPADEARPAFVPDTGFDTAADTGAPAPVPTGPITPATPGTVAAIQADPTFCWLTRTDAAGPSLAVDVVGLGSSRIANLQTLPATPGFQLSTSILRERTKLVVIAQAASGSRAIVLDAQTGAPLNDRPIGRASLHAAGGTYVEELLPSPGVKLFTSVAGVLSGAGTTSTASGVSVWGNGDVAYPATWHATDTVRIFDPVTLQLQRSVVTLGFDTWVRDVQLDGNRIYLLDDGRSGYGAFGAQLLWVFNATTGAHLRSVELSPSHDYGAFVCRSAP
jgi:hypothetical protein